MRVSRVVQVAKYSRFKVLDNQTVKSSNITPLNPTNLIMFKTSTSKSQN